LLSPVATNSDMQRSTPNGLHYNTGSWKLEAGSW
jgi:hypothetical protein